MNPWSRTESRDEEAERELFARRARALDAEDVPSLASIVRVADARASVRAARTRTVTTIALAAASVAAVWVRLPSLSVSSEIVAERDAGAPRVALAAASTELCSAEDESTCKDVANTYASAELPACVAQPATFSAYARQVSERAPLSCEEEESCSIAVP